MTRHDVAPATAMGYVALRSLRPSLGAPLATLAASTTLLAQPDNIIGVGSNTVSILALSAAGTLMF